MSDAEYELWEEANRASRSKSVKSPCADCTMAFALTMRAQDACDGNPGGNPGHPLVPSGDPVRDALRRRWAANARFYRARKAAAA